MTTLPAIQNVRTRHEWAEIINADWRKSIESIIQIGRDLSAARGELSESAFANMVKVDLPFSRRTADRLMNIANHPAITRSASMPTLPPTYTVLARLASLSVKNFETALERGLISADTSKRKAAAIRGAYKAPTGCTPPSGSPSQAAIADAKRNRLTNVYSAVRDAAKARMLAGKTDPQELIPEGSEKPNQQTRDIRAKAAGCRGLKITRACRANLSR